MSSVLAPSLPYLFSLTNTFLSYACRARGGAGPRTLGSPEGSELARQKLAMEVCLTPASVPTSWGLLETSLGVQTLALLDTCIPSATATHSPPPLCLAAAGTKNSAMPAWQ